MKDKKILVCEDFLTDVEAIELLINENKFDMIKYPYIKKFLFLNIPLLESDNNDKYYYEYELKRDCDFANDFTLTANGLDVNFTFICGLNEYKIDDIKEVIPASISYIYKPLKLRITFNELPKIEKQEQEITFSYSKYLCNRNLSNLLFNNLESISLMVP